jgi:hypothetical protein
VLPTSRWANAACWLGFLSILPAVGIAAFLAGLIGLRDLRRYPGRRGLGWAVFGMVAGGLTTLGWLLLGLIVFSIASAVSSTRLTTKPSEIEEIGAGIAPFKVPPGLQPLDGQHFPWLNLRSVCYGRTANPQGAPGTKRRFDIVLIVSQIPPQGFAEREQTERLLRDRALGYIGAGVAFDQTKEVPYTIRGKPVNVTVRLGKDPGTGQRLRQYLAIFTGPSSGRIGVMLFTEEPKGLNEAEVQAFFESFQ